MFDYKQKLNRKQSVLTAAQFKQLVWNHGHGDDEDKVPVVKFFDPCGAGTWLVSELDPETGIAFGLADLGMGSPELGSIDLNELIGIQHVQRKPFRVGIERDLWFKGEHDIMHYAIEAMSKGKIQV